MRIAIIEDEPLAAQRLRGLLADYPNGTVTVVGEADSIAEAVESLPTWDLELLLCDIRLADGLSFNIWKEVDVPVPTIFTTAYEEYALQAFKVNSVDYLLKPIQPEDLFAALDRFAKEWKHDDETSTGAAPQLSPKLIAEVAAMVQGQRYRERFMSKVGDKLMPIAVAEVAFFQSIDRITWAYQTSGSRHPIAETLDELEAALDPRRFRRLNRAVIAQDSSVEQLTAYSNSRYRAHLTGQTGEAIIIARDRVPGIKAWLAGG